MNQLSLPWSWICPAPRASTFRIGRKVASSSWVRLVFFKSIIVLKLIPNLNDWIRYSSAEMKLKFMRFLPWIAFGWIPLLKSLSLKSTKSTRGDRKCKSPASNCRNWLPKRTIFLKLGKKARSRGLMVVNLPEFNQSEWSLGSCGRLGGTENLLP